MSRPIYRQKVNQSDVDSYFGPRNTVKLVPQLGTNYTPETLAVTEKRTEADQIANTIDSLFHDRYNVAIVSPGIGGVIFALADLSNVDKIYASEPNPAVRQILSNNISAYQINKIELTPQLPFEGISMLYLDLIKNPKTDVDAYLAAKEYPLYAIRVPASYHLKEDPNYQCVFQPTGNPQSQLLLCELIGQTQEESISIDDVWLDNLINVIDKILAKIITDTKPYLAEDLLSYWVQALTSKTIDPNLNYETLEMFGDRLMKTTFADYLIQRVEGITERQLTELQNYYLSTLQQSNFSKSLGLASVVRVAGEPPEKVFEDIFESFFGALFRVSEAVRGGYGYYNAFRLISAIYQNEPIEKMIPELERGRDKTVYQQSLGKLGFPYKKDGGTEVESVIDGMVHFKVLLPPGAQKFFAGYGIRLPNEMGYGIAKSKTGAATVAYSKALETLEDNGITPEWIEKTREILMFDKPEYNPYIGKARARLAREGFDRMTFSQPASTSTTNRQVVQLIGIRPNGSQAILATVTDSTNSKLGRIEALRRYAEG